MSDAPPEPITLEQAKANLRVDAIDATDEALILSLIVAAREHVEDYTGLVLTPRSITETARSLGQWIDLTSWPVRAVTAIRYPLAGVLTPLADGAWLMNLNRRPVRLLPASWGWGVSAPSLCGAPTLPVEIDVDAGFASPDEVPATVKQAMQLLVGTWYANRENDVVGKSISAIDLPSGVKLLLARWRLVTI